MPQPIKLLALDLDGTLAQDNNEISSATQKALYKLHHQEAVEVVIATGRRYRGSRQVIDNLGFEVFCICCDGALVKDPQQQTIHATTYAEDELELIVNTARTLGLALIGQQDSPQDSPDFIVDSAVEPNGAVIQYLERNIGYFHRNDLLGTQSNFLIIGAFDRQIESLQTFAEAIHASAPGKYKTIIVPYFSGKGYYCGVTLDHITKWHGLTYLAKKFNITSDNISAAGDQLNDLTMVKAAGLGVAMGNAEPALKDVADMVCGNYDSDGLLDVIKQIQHINSNA